jgi:hypothetical protein
VNQSIAGLVVIVIIIVGRTIVSHPAGVRGASRLVDEVTDRVFFVVPEPPNPTGVPMLPPQLKIDATLGN